MHRTIHAITVIIMICHASLYMAYICCVIRYTTKMSETPPRYDDPARGITRADVSQAADALLRAGERPTVEKIRAAVGHGSPNTVGPLLDAWWKRLAGRSEERRVGKECRSRW